MYTEGRLGGVKNYFKGAAFLQAALAGLLLSSLPFFKFLIFPFDALTLRGTSQAATFLTLFSFLIIFTFPSTRSGRAGAPTFCPCRK